jgi:hypothetical protein
MQIKFQIIAFSINSLSFQSISQIQVPFVIALELNTKNKRFGPNLLLFKMGISPEAI